MLFTIGYEKRSSGEFYGLLRSHKIAHIFDVRSKPNGRRAEFNPGVMSSSGFGYEWLGATCGGFGVITDGAILTLADKIAIKEAQGVNSVLVCFERDFKQCHRFYDLTRRLEPYGIKAVHI